MIAWLWAFYFAAKLWLHLTGVIHMHFWPNLALLALAMPLSPHRGKGKVWVRRLLQGGAVVLGAVILWYDSYLPPFLYSVQFVLRNTGMLSSGFMNEFAKGFFGGGTALALLTLLALCVVAAKKELHPTPAVFLALLIVPVQALREPGDEIGRAAEKFYSGELNRRVRMPRENEDRPFDIVLVQVCSLSWDDLDAVGDPRPKLLEGANILFTGFNSATSYSTPAALRLLRAPCGQVRHKELYEPWPEECSLLTQLRAAGFKSYGAFNTDSRYFGMAQDLQKMAGLDAPLPVDGIPVQMLSFDKQPVLQNGPVLERWWELRSRSNASRAVLFFNTISLHGGGHEDKPGWWNDAKAPFYVKTLDALADDVSALERGIAASGRSAVVVIVPEHGRALRGSIVQPSDLRDIPLPRITRVPVAVRLVGPLFAGAPTGLRAEAPVSYLALAQLLADLVEDPTRNLQQTLSKLPMTEAMSETEKWKVYQYSGRTFVFGKDGTWRPLPPEAAAKTVAAR